MCVSEGPGSKVILGVMVEVMDREVVVVVVVGEERETETVRVKVGWRTKRQRPWLTFLNFSTPVSGSCTFFDVLILPSLPSLIQV